MVAFQCVLLFAGQNVPFQPVRRGVLCFKDDGAPAVKGPLKIRLGRGGEPALEDSAAQLLHDAERFGGLVHVGPLPLRIQGARGFYGPLEKMPLRVVDLVLILQGRTPLVDLHLLSLRFLFHSFVVIAARERL